MEFHPPEYPISRIAFARALRTGHGRALIHAERFGVAEFRDEILHAATTFLVYDTHMNGQLEGWLARLCEFAGLVDIIIGLQPDESPRNRDLRAGLLKEFHLAGHPEALLELRAMCIRPPGSSNFEAISDLIEADGVNGFVFAARKLGEELIADPEFMVFDYELWKFDDMHSKGMGRALMDRLAPDDAAIRHYLQKLAAYEKRSNEPVKPSSIKTQQSVDSVIQTILTSTELVRNLRRWGNKTSPDNRARVAGLLKTETEPMVLANTLWCLCDQRVDDFDPAFLEFVFHENADVRYYAGRLFANHDEPLVRQAGLALLEHGDAAIGLKLLQKSVRDEDTEAIAAALARHDFDEDPHELLMDVNKLLESHDSIQDTRLAIFVYEFMPCMYCRSHAVELLMNWENCPAWVIEEAAKDGSEDIRKLVER